MRTYDGPKKTVKGGVPVTDPNHPFHTFARPTPSMHMADVVRHIKDGVTINRYSATNARTSYDENGTPCVNVWNVDANMNPCLIVAPDKMWQDVHWYLCGRIIDRKTKQNINDVSKIHSSDAVIDLVAKANCYGCDVEIKLGMYEFTFKQETESSGIVLLIGPVKA